MGLFPCRRGQLGRGGRGGEGVGQREGDRVWVRRGRAGGQQSGPLLPGGPEEGKSGLERRPGLRRGQAPIPCIIPRTGVLPVYSCSKSGEDLLPSQEPIYAAFSFSSPVTLRLCVCVCVFGSNKVPQQQEEPFPLPDPLLGTRQMGRGLPCPLQATQGWIGAHTRAAGVVALAAPSLTASRPRGQQEVGFGEQGPRARGREGAGEGEGLQRVGWGSQCGHGWWAYGLLVVCACHVFPHVSMIPPPSHFLGPWPMDLLMKPTDFFPLFHGPSASSHPSHHHLNRSKRSRASHSCLPTSPPCLSRDGDSVGSYFLREEACRSTRVSGSKSCFMARLWLGRLVDIQWRHPESLERRMQQGVGTWTQDLWAWRRRH